MAVVITMTGASQSGKSTIGHIFLKQKNDNFNPIIFKKYTTRPPRENDDVICVEKIPDKCDLVYEQYGVRYGLEFAKIYQHLQKGESSIIVLNYVRAIDDVRIALGPQVISLFIYRMMPNRKLFASIEKE